MIRNDIDFNYLAQLYQSGVSSAELGKRFSIKPDTIINRFKKMGIVVRNREEAAKIKRINIDADELIRLYNSGISVKALGKHFGCNATVIKSRLIENGVTIRGRSDAMYTRMAQTTTEERIRLTAAAHSAIRGKCHTEEHMEKIAATRERRQTFISRSEEILADMLRERGFPCTLQKAFGKYNVDISLDEFPVIVEVNGGGWHTYGKHAARYAERTKYLLDSGVDVIIIWVNGKSIPLESGAADYIITISRELCREKTMRGKEHMIWGNGKSTSVGQRKFNNLPVIPSSECRDEVTGQFKPRPFDETIMM
jgi:very-short-patch-repair endonuclease